jgi:hypothetical protein
MSIFPCSARVLVLAAFAMLAVSSLAQSNELLDPLVTPDTIQTTICQPYYADRQRFPFEQAMRIKSQLLRAEGLPPQAAPDFALDRRVPVILGGSPSALTNFELVKWDGKNGDRRRVRVAVKLKDAVCSGQIGLRAAQSAIANDWESAFKRFVHPPKLE